MGGPVSVLDTSEPSDVSFDAGAPPPGNGFRLELLVKNALTAWIYLSTTNPETISLVNYSLTYFLHPQQN